MRRIRLIVEYDGTDYIGWQIQNNGVSVQQCLNEALHTVTGEEICVHGSGRTDSGVHARAQVVHFDTSVRMPADKFAIAMNMRLPHSIRVLFSEETNQDFHARFSVLEKSYRYSIQVGPHARVQTSGTTLHVHVPLDTDALHAAAKEILGTHDFTAFMAAGSSTENAVRTILKSEWLQQGSYLYYDVTGTGFLYNMVRILVGTMLEIAWDKRSSGAIARALTSGRRNDAGSTAPAKGLCLMRVRYENFDTETILQKL